MNSHTKACLSGLGAGALFVLTFVVAACAEYTAPAQAQEPKRFELTGKDEGNPLRAYCDTDNGNLIYLAAWRYDAVAIAVVPGGCKR